MTRILVRRVGDVSTRIVYSLLPSGMVSLLSILLIGVVCTVFSILLCIARTTGAYSRAATDEKGRPPSAEVPQYAAGDCGSPLPLLFTHHGLGRTPLSNPSKPVSGTSTNKIPVAAVSAPEVIFACSHPMP